MFFVLQLQLHGSTYYVCCMLQSIVQWKGSTNFV